MTTEINSIEGRKSFVNVWVVEVCFVLWKWLMNHTFKIMKNPNFWLLVQLNSILFLFCWIYRMEKGFLRIPIVWSDERCSPYLNNYLWLPALTICAVMYSFVWSCQHTLCILIIPSHVLSHGNINVAELDCEIFHNALHPCCFGYSIFIENWIIHIFWLFFFLGGGYNLFKNRSIDINHNLLFY